MTAAGASAGPSAAGLIVVGGGPSGHSAAAAYRDAGGSGRVMIISADRHPPYNRPPLSKDFLRGESETDALPLEAPEFYRDNEIELVLGEPVSHLDPAGRTVTTGSNRLIGYRNCVLATGCVPAVLPVPGAEHPAVLRLRFLDQAQRLRARAEGADSAIVAGSGFIGCEAAVSLAMRGIAVTVLSAEKLPQLERLGRAAAERLAGWLTEAGVSLRGGVQITGIDDGQAVMSNGGDRFAADLVLTAAGVVPQSEFAAEAGLAVQDGRILADQRMATSLPEIYAVGDVALAHNGTAGRRLKVEHWGEALRMGEVAGVNAAGGDDSWSDVPGFWSEIGARTLKYAAWGDGYDSDELVEHDGGGFTVWYSRVERIVGVLTHDADDDYERGSKLIAAGSAVPAGGWD